MIISANDLKTKGVSLLDTLFTTLEEVVISVRGKNRYVVIDIERYQKMRALELDAAYNEVMEEIKRGDVATMSVAEHLKEVDRIVAKTH
ncbi:MAG: prevent-host-death protein [Campylobacterales bacterium]|nr:prevent-host-death protein [Campylobacterales bacterium]